MAPMRRALFVLALLVAIPAFAQDDLPFETVRFDGGAMAVPKDWRSVDVPGELLYRQGDGIGVPAVDETDSPLQIGMSIAKRPDSNYPLDLLTEALVKAAASNPDLEWIDKEIVKIKLADGTDARLLRGQFTKEKTRRSLQLKLIAVDASGTLWVAAAYLTGGLESAWPKPGSALAKWLEAHLASLVFDEKKFDAEKVKAAYATDARPES